MHDRCINSLIGDNPFNIFGTKSANMYGKSTALLKSTVLPLKISSFLKGIPFWRSLRIQVYIFHNSQTSWSATCKITNLPANTFCSKLQLSAWSEMSKLHRSLCFWSLKKKSHTNKFFASFVDTFISHVNLFSYPFQGPFLFFGEENPAQAAMYHVSYLDFWEAFC